MGWCRFDLNRLTQCIGPRSSQNLAQNTTAAAHDSGVVGFDALVVAGDNGGHGWMWETTTRSKVVQVGFGDDGYVWVELAGVGSNSGALGCGRTARCGALLVKRMGPRGALGCGGDDRQDGSIGRGITSPETTKWWWSLIRLQCIYNQLILRALLRKFTPRKSKENNANL